MAITKRLLNALAQMVGATLAGYIAAYVTLHFIIPVFVSGLMASTGACVIAVWGIGRVFTMRGSFDAAAIGAGIGAAIGFVILTTGAARDNVSAYATLALIPAVLGTAAYQWSAFQASRSSRDHER